MPPSALQDHREGTLPLGDSADELAVYSEGEEARDAVFAAEADLAAAELAHQAHRPLGRNDGGLFPAASGMEFIHPDLFRNCKSLIVTGLPPRPRLHLRRD